MAWPLLRSEQTITTTDFEKPLENSPGLFTRDSGILPTAKAFPLNRAASIASV
jgi:hypothetical protein